MSYGDNFMIRKLINRLHNAFTRLLDKYLDNASDDHIITLRKNDKLIDII